MICELDSNDYCKRHQSYHRGPLKEIALDATSSRAEALRQQWDRNCGVAKPLPSQCVHLGEPTGQTVTCGSCREGTHLKTFACEVHGTCTVDRKANNTACCNPKDGNQCQDYLEKLPMVAVTKKRALLTLNIGNVLQQKSRESLQNAAQRWSMDYVEFTEPLQAVGGMPHWQKTFLADWALQHGYGQCLYIDSDVLIREDCPDFPGLVMPGRIGVVRNDQLDGVLWKDGEQNRYYHTLNWWAKKLNINCPDIVYDHVNSGMFVFEPKAHNHFFERWQEAGKSVGWGRPTKLIDQSPFSVILSSLPGDSKTFLPMQFNTLIYRQELVSSNGYMQSFVYHYTGHQKHNIRNTEWRKGKQSIRRTTPSLLPGSDLKTLFQRAVCINLDRRTDRWHQFNAGLPQPWPFVPVQRCRAIDVRQCPPPSWFVHNAGHWGCNRSHMRAIEDALNDGIESLLIFEDDAEFRPHFLGHFQNFIKDVPNDWELLFLGGAHTHGQRKPVNAHVEIPGYVTLNHAYALRGNGLKLAYEWMNQYTPKRAENDHRLAALSESGKCKVYAPRSWLVYQSTGYSDLTLKNRPLRGVGDNTGGADVWPIQTTPPQEIDIEGWLTKPEGQHLANLATGKIVLEIGSYYGRSTIWLARTAKEVQCVDTFKGTGLGEHRPSTWEEFNINLKRFGVEVKAHIGLSQDIVPNLTDKFELIFIDGNHNEPFVRTDIAMSINKLLPGGLIALHDYGDEGNPDVAIVVDSLLFEGILEKVGDVVDTLITVRPKNVNS